MPMNIVDFFQIIHIQKNKAAAVLFHKFGDQLFSKGSHRKPGEQIIMLGFFLVLYGGNHIRNKFADGIVNFRLCCSLCFW